MNRKTIHIIFVYYNATIKEIFKWTLRYLSRDREWREFSKSTLDLWILYMNHL